MLSEIVLRLFALTLLHKCVASNTAIAASTLKIQVSVSTLFTGVNSAAFNTTEGRDTFKIAATLDQIAVYPDDVVTIEIVENETLRNAFRSSRHLQSRESGVNVHWLVKFPFEERGYSNATVAYASFVSIFNANIDNDEFIATLRFSDPSFSSINHEVTTFFPAEVINLSPTLQPTFTPVSVQPSDDDINDDVVIAFVIIFIIILAMVCCLAAYCYFKDQVSDDKNLTEVDSRRVIFDVESRATLSSVRPFTDNASQDIKDMTKNMKPGDRIRGRIFPSRMSIVVPVESSAEPVVSGTVSNTVPLIKQQVCIFHT